MEKIRFFLKFGERIHLESLLKGKLYFSNAKTFWGIEDEQKIKGQGDILEAGAKIFAQKIEMRDPNTNKIKIMQEQANVILRAEPAERMPVFCLFAVYDEDCRINEDGQLIISLSDKKKKTISEHFPKADSVAIISNPDIFIKDVKRTIGFNIQSDCVQYFNIDKGYITSGGEIALDMDYMKYLTQDAPPVTKNGAIVYSFCVDYAYRVLFCKDVFFKDEQEYRIVLPDEIIDEGTYYPVTFSEQCTICNLQEFFNK